MSQTIFVHNVDLLDIRCTQRDRIQGKPQTVIKVCTEDHGEIEMHLFHTAQPRLNLNLHEATLGGEEDMPFSLEEVAEVSKPEDEEFIPPNREG